MKTITKSSEQTFMTLGNVAKFIRGITFKPEELIEGSDEGAVACMRTKNVQFDLDESDILFVPSELVKREEQFLQPNDMLVSTANSWELVGKTSWVHNLKYRATAGGFISILRANQSKIVPRYLFHWFTSPAIQSQVRHCGRKTTNISNLNYEQCLSIEIPLPQLPEQRRIADILDKADAIRRKQQVVVGLSGDFLPSLFANMFGPSGNKYGTEPLDRHLKFITSGSRGWAEHYVPVGKRFIRSLDVQMNRIGTDDVVFVNPPNGTEADRTRVQDGDVLVTITGSRIGRVSFVPENFGEAYVSQHVSIVRLASSLRPRYCSMFLSLADGGQRQIASAQYGQTKPGLSLTNIREFQIPIPPVSEQDRFIAIWTRHEDLTARVIQGVSRSNGLFNSLVQRAFRGEL